MLRDRIHQLQVLTRAQAVTLVLLVIVVRVVAFPVRQEGMLRLQGSLRVSRARWELLVRQLGRVLVLNVQKVGQIRLLVQLRALYVSPGPLLQRPEM